MSEPFNLVPGKLDINAVTGDDFSVLLDFSNDLTGYTFDARVLLDNNPYGRYQQITITNTNLALGRITLSLSDTQTRLLGPISNKKWFISWSQGADIRTVLSGGFTLNQPWAVTDYSPTTTDQTIVIQTPTISVEVIGGVGGAVLWGDIQGDIEDQTDLIEYISNQVGSTAPRESYLFSHMIQGAQESMYLSASPDGVRFVSLNNGVPLYTPPTGALRDPSIGQIGNDFWVLYTIGYPEQTTAFGVAKSIGGILNWQFVANISVASLGSVEYTWAPELFIDNDGPHALITIKLAGQNYKIYEMHPTNAGWTTWSAPVLMNIPASGSIIDAYVLKEGSNYRLGVYNFPGLYQFFTATNLIGPYVADPERGPFSAFIPGEGGIILKINNGYRFYHDSTDGGYYYLESPDLIDWTPSETPYAGIRVQSDMDLRHGSIITVGPQIGLPVLPVDNSPQTNNRPANDQLITGGTVSLYPDNMKSIMAGSKNPDGSISEEQRVDYFNSSEDKSVAIFRNWSAGEFEGRRVGLIITLSNPVAGDNVARIFVSPDNSGIPNGEFIFGSATSGKLILFPGGNTTLEARPDGDVIIGRNASVNGAYYFNANGVNWSYGSGSPQGVISAPPGSIYSDTTNGFLYEKITGSGNTGWSNSIQYGGVTASAANQYLRRNAANSAYEYAPKTEYITIIPTDGQAIAFNDNPNDQVFYINPAGDLTDLQLILPSNATSINTQKVVFCVTHNIINLDLTGATTIYNAPVTMNAGDCFQFYKMASNVWARVIT